MFSDMFMGLGSLVCSARIKGCLRHCLIAVIQMSAWGTQSGVGMLQVSNRVATLQISATELLSAALWWAVGLGSLPSRPLPCLGGSTTRGSCPGRCHGALLVWL